MTSHIVFQWENSNYMSIFIETPSQLFENRFDRRLVGKVYEERRLMTFWKAGKMTSRKIRKRSLILDTAMRHIPEVRKMIRRGTLGNLMAIDAKTVVIDVEEHASRLDKFFGES
ncbi:hypothetical protein PBI_CANTARE_100 [Brevibacterium phage Cantare]|uniref:Uncharacterized protein n=1 Tax=Brevibacterium phage Cantare TaxID=2338395 RepID=A0A3G3LYU6_9CAUD|nr:hypothetical protein PQD70_gp100 [Brevibacterium phage Cantare]AYQ99320.1 hypothetical protein PBI_CANTARE_100 [Brevibacterium phage Cantare]